MADPHSSLGKDCNESQDEASCCNQQTHKRMKWCKVMEVYFFLWGCAEMSLLVGQWVTLAFLQVVIQRPRSLYLSFHPRQDFQGCVFRGASEEGRLGDCAQKSFIFKIKRVKGVCITYDHIRSAAHLSHDHKEVWEMWSCHFPGERGNR